MKIELKHLAPYLPYGLKIRCFRKGEKLFLEDLILTGEILDYILSEDANRYNYYKPILRPLSDLTKEIEHNGEKFVPIDWFENKYYTLDLHKQCKRLLEEDGENWIYQSDYMIVGQLFEWHFDVFGLIPQNLAIDLNTLKP